MKVYTTRGGAHAAAPLGSAIAFARSPMNLGHLASLQDLRGEDR